MVHFFSFWLHPSQPHFDQLIVGGIFTPTYFIVTFFLIGIGLLLFRWLVNQPHLQQQRYFQIIAVGLITLEIIRMAWNVIAADDWYAKDVWPLYTCGIFVIIFPLYAFNTRLKKWTVGFLSLGAMLAGIVFLVFPSTGLGMFPLWHLNTIISSIMHLLMAVIGAIFFLDSKLKLTLFDFYAAIGIVFGFALVSFIYNTLDPATNFFFIKSPFAETPLQWIFDELGQPFYGISILVLHVLEGGIMYILHQRWIVKQKTTH